MKKDNIFIMSLCLHVCLSISLRDLTTTFEPLPYFVHTDYLVFHANMERRLFNITICRTWENYGPDLHIPIKDHKFATCDTAKKRVQKLKNTQFL